MGLLFLILIICVAISFYTIHHSEPDVEDEPLEDELLEGDQQNR